MYFNIKLIKLVCRIVLTRIKLVILVSNAYIFDKVCLLIIVQIDFMSRIDNFEIMAIFV